MVKESSNASEKKEDVKKVDDVKKEDVKKVDVVKKEDVKKVEIDTDVLRRLVATVESQKQDIDDLKSAADVGRMSRILQERESGKLVKNAKVSMWEGKIVVGWVGAGDDVFFDEQGRLHEDQKVCLFLHNSEGEPDKTDPISYREFARVTTKVEGEVVKESKSSDGQVFFTVLLDDGLEVELGVQFAN